MVAAVDEATADDDEADGVIAVAASFEIVAAVGVGPVEAVAVVMTVVTVTVAPKVTDAFLHREALTCPTLGPGDADCDGSVPGNGYDWNCCCCFHYLLVLIAAGYFFCSSSVGFGTKSLPAAQ